MRVCPVAEITMSIYVLWLVFLPVVVALNMWSALSDAAREWWGARPWIWS